MNAAAIFLLRPGDIVISALLASACAAIVVCWSPGLTVALAVHGGLLAVYLVLMAASIRRPTTALSVTRVMVTVVYLAVLYTSLGLLGFQLQHGTWDGVLATIDQHLLGVQAAEALEPWITPIRVELLSAVYVWFLAYVYLSVVLGCLGREPEDREEFLCGLTMLYCAGYLGYLLVPAHGPVDYLANQFHTPLRGFFMARVMNGMVHTAGGAIGAFPSLHVGGVLFLCLFDLQRNSIRGLTYVPVVFLVALSTVFLRQHYVVDWIGGALLAVCSLAVARQLSPWWANRQRGLGLAISVAD